MTRLTQKLQQLSEEARTFWEEKQESLQEELLFFSYSNLVESPQSPAYDKSGVLYLMERHLWFEDFPKAPVFFLPQRSEYTKTLIQVPRAAITHVEFVKESVLPDVLQGKQPSQEMPRSFLWRIFHSDPLHLIVSGQEESNAPFRYIFRDFDEPETWRQLLLP